MNTEINVIIAGFKEVLSGDPWYGKSAMPLFEEVNPSVVFKKLHPDSHSMIDLIYHMVTWTEFARFRLERDRSLDLKAFDALDWRETNAGIHTWQNGISQFVSETNKIIALLNDAPDEILNEVVDYRKYNFRVLLNGLIQHNIYHLGQIAYINKIYS